MKDGIVRRIDNLGRIVIPKNIRKSIKIKPGDSLEITEEENCIILKKYSELENIETIGKIITETLKEITNAEVYITSTDKIVINSSNSKIQNKELSNKIIEIIEKRQLTKVNNINITKNTNQKGEIIISPIISGGDLYGSLIVNSKQKLYESNIITIMTNMLSKYLED